ncbi:GntR family transcriptional regulator [Microbacterium profundi]|uniref:GntR family transcriptional regulator n=1 Tax=Microbacterium profundi TaxID=450380 RepID=UPI001F1A8D82|nr:GntR family transcriptional regulator [Microbacterium profundi]MCE7481198.1 GntR family transcriptional regulator [Microbacterium profundi]
MHAFTVKHDSPLTAWGQVHRDLRQRIEVGEFVPGNRLPSEAELVTAYTVSRATVRRAIEALIADGYVHSRRGSGTFVNKRADLFRCEVELLRPWREQLLASGFVARSRLLEYEPDTEIPPVLRPNIEHDHHDRMSFGLHLQEVNGIAIAITQSWIPAHAMVLTAMPRTALVTAASAVRVDFADRSQAALLGAHHDVPLVEIVTTSRLRETGELVELARTSWVANRVRLVYRRNLVVGQIDMSELLSELH